jgi:protein tyrosine phosphatase (PTP) superfamily phosphohydrolase (DUF442 family)
MSWFNTLKTTVGYLWTLVARHLPSSLHRKELAAIFNFVPIDDRIATSGQPNNAQLAALREAGYEVIINLAPHYGENSLKDERGTVTSLGMQYVHIPVDFKKPTNADFEKFCVAMKSAQDRRVLVHCAANMRASSFAYRYRCQVLGENPAIAARDLHRVWFPVGVWKQFSAVTATA